MNTYVREYDIIILVKPPNTLYIVFATPHKTKYLLLETAGSPNRPFFMLFFIETAALIFSVSYVKLKKHVLYLCAHAILTFDRRVYH